MRNAARFLLALFIVCVLMSLTAQMDMDDALQQQRVYCDNVYNGVWPDYEKSYSTQCEKDDIKKVSK